LKAHHFLWNKNTGIWLRILTPSPCSGKQTFPGNSWMHHKKGKSTKVSKTAMSLKVKKTPSLPP